MIETPQTRQFVKHNYINLETYRKSGEGVRTPVWFVEVNGSIFVRTMAGSAKVKRLLRNKRVRITPCDAAGRLLGQWTDAEAHVIMDVSQTKQLEKLMTKKYGLLKRLFDLRQLWEKTEMATIQISFS